MLVHLRIRDFVLIDELDLEFQSGFNVFTGETGAGKSLIAAALNLLLGRRGSGDLVRRGAETAEIEGVFDISDEPKVKSRLGNAGLPVNDDLLIRRVIPAKGRHRCYVNGRISSLGLLGELAVGLAHIMSQHEQHSLGDPATQISLLDGFGGHEKEVAEMAKCFDEMMAVEAELELLRGKEADRTGRLDYLSFQLDEIDRVDPRPGELEELERDVTRLRNVEKLTSTLEHTAMELYEGDGSIYDRLSVAARDLEEMTKYDESLDAPKDQLVDAAAVVEDAARVISQYGKAEDVSEEMVSKLDDRLDALRRLGRKHNTDLDGVMELREKLRGEIDILSKYDEAIEAAQAAHFEKVQRAKKRASKLTSKRKKTATTLSKTVTRELGDLSFDGAGFNIDIGPSTSGLGRTGEDRVRFLVRLNPGEGTHPISKVASGGELSRLMLAVKRALLGVGPAGTYVFDEVDAGIGGAVATAVGKKLLDVATKHQVVCITHLPQIAGMGDSHFMVSKKRINKRTITRIEKLGKKDRVEELSRMLGGETVTSKTRAAARELMKSEAKK